VAHERGRYKTPAQPIDRVAGDAPNTLEETRRYIRDFDRIDAASTTARDLYDQMLAVYPDRVNPGVLSISARAVKS
jgi:hypothetical protein